MLKLVLKWTNQEMLSLWAVPGLNRITSYEMGLETRQWKEKKPRLMNLLIHPGRVL